MRTPFQVPPGADARCRPQDCLARPVPSLDATRHGAIAVRVVSVLAGLLLSAGVAGAPISVSQIRESYSGSSEVVSRGLRRAVAPRTAQACSERR
jgi:hypothetical protein